MIGVGVVGYGYWGPNLARNFAAQPGCRLVAICDAAEARLAQARHAHPGCHTTRDYRELLSNDEIQAILIATPVATHFALARDALRAGKDVLVEKPLTQTAAEAWQLVELAQSGGRILAVDHTFLYTGAVSKIKQLVDSGELGEILYIDSVRTNLGLFQSDSNVVYDLAPHELSIVFHLLDRDPVSVQAVGACHAHNRLENLAYVHLEFDDQLIAHFHLNWLAPVKLRQTVIAGRQKMVVYDDMERSEKIKIYDKGIDIKEQTADAAYKLYVDYRTGDMVAPKLSQREALHAEAEHFLDCVRRRARPLADGHAGWRVVRILEAAQESLSNRGARIQLEPAAAETIPLPDRANLQCSLPRRKTA
ncbi:MAG TPA: Gfo/Idh/MocA family oxidoreductase [Pirellulales bacterium]|nr:Gfo/Idh/MocA family oxidoreductase [Pirellulales bacterium]